MLEPRFGRTLLLVTALLAAFSLAGCPQFSQFVDTVNDPNAPPRVRLVTTEGEILIELDPDAAPATVLNFRRYVNSQFYDGTIFHRVIPDFVIQAGGFLPDLSEKTAGNPIPLETTGLLNVRGSVAMARTNDPDSARAQFFINLVDNTGLDPQPEFPGYAVFGRVINGMEVVDAIAASPTQTEVELSDVPVTDVVILQAREETPPLVIDPRTEAFLNNIGSGFSQLLEAIAREMAFVAVDRVIF